MRSEYTAVIKQDGKWWIGWVEEIPGINCQEQSKQELTESLHEALREALREALAFNREDARKAAGDGFSEIKLAV
jgi:predicted RNase H-like HicB family nuclease